MQTRKLGTLLPLLTCLILSIVAGGAALAAFGMKHPPPDNPIGGHASIDAGSLAMTVSTAPMTTNTTLAGTVAGTVTGVEHTHTHDLFCPHPHVDALPDDTSPVSYDVDASVSQPSVNPRVNPRVKPSVNASVNASVSQPSVKPSVKPRVNASVSQPSVNPRVNASVKPRVNASVMRCPDHPSVRVVDGCPVDITALLW